MLTKEELQLRRGKIGSSDAPIILDISPWKTRYELWEEKVLGPSPKTSSAMQRGNDLEPVALEQFEKDTGIPMMKPSAPFFHKERDWQMATLDGISFGGDAIVEIKCPNREVHQMALEKKLPQHYYAQVQHQLAVVDIQMAFYYSFDGHTGAVVEVKRDQAFLDNLLEEEEAFFKMIKNQEPPSMTEKDYPVVEDDVMFELRHRYEEAVKHSRHWDAKLDEIKSAIKEHVGHRNARGFGLKATKSVIPGRVNYREIPELREVDIAAYRGSPIEQWRITIEKST